MSRHILGRSRKGPAVLSKNDRDLAVTMLTGAWTKASIEYARADDAARQHLSILMDTILDVVKTLEGE